MRYDLDASEVEDLQQLMQQYGDRALKAIDDILHGEGAKEITEKIMMLLPASGRSWKGKKTAARDTQPFTQQDIMLGVTIKSVTRYNYLYFPDDGSNTYRHAGNQQFMYRGAENASKDILDLCVGRLTEEF